MGRFLSETVSRLWDYISFAALNTGLFFLLMLTVLDMAYAP